MGLLDPNLFTNPVLLNQLKGLLGNMPISKLINGEESVTKEGLLGAMRAMPVFQNDAGQSAYDAAMNIGPMGLGKIVYHGSPHKFDKFDASKIGTGEGAQAYGHGVYLADAEDVAKGYSKLSSSFLKIDGVPYEATTTAINASPGNYAAAALSRFPNDRKAALDWLGEFAPKEARAMVRKAAIEPMEGQTYKADLPDEWIPKMLDWDKPIKELPQPVQQNIYNKLTDIGIDKGVVNHILNNKTGQELMNELAGRMSVRNPSPMPGSAQASQLLREAGIPGIRYLDGGSRGKGQGSYNYVVFPGLEDKVKILERNGVPLQGLLGGS